MLETTALLSCLFLAPAPSPAGWSQTTPAQVIDEEEPGEVFENVISVLDRWFPDKVFRADVLPGLAAGLRERAHAAPNPAAERAVINELLAQIPTSHLALISVEAYRLIGAELFGKPTPTFGMQLTLRDGSHHATWVYEGGPASLAGVKRGDEVLSIDGLPPRRSARLDWSTDDAALSDAAMHALHAETGDRIRLELKRCEGETLTVEIEASPYSGSMAAEASARIVESSGLQLGYVHFWYIQADAPSALLRSLLEDRFAACDGLILDLRGRGGSAMEAMKIQRLIDLEKGIWGRPLVALTDRGTRSAKEVIAHGIQVAGIGKIVGERTAGAVVPAAFKEVGGGAVLMFPMGSLGKLTEQLEGKGVVPDVKVADTLPYTAGADPILEAGVRVLSADCTALESGR